MFEDNSALIEKRNLSDDQKWHDWIRRESVKRFAHFIFINDTQHSCLYGHQGIMSVWEMKLAMPCSDSLWNASSPQEWRRIMTEERKSRATTHDGPPVTLLDLITAFISPHAGFSTIDHRSVPLDGLGLYTVVHGIFSVAWHFKNRKIPHYWANMMHIKVDEPADGEDDVRWLLSALNEWKSRYNLFWQAARYPIGYQPPSAMWSPPFRVGAGAMYDLACLWLQAPLGDFQVAAGSRFAQGRLRHRVQQSWNRINKKALNDDVCHHALNLLEAELLYRNETTGHHGLHSYLTDPSYPLFMPFVAYLGGLALWAYSCNLERTASYSQQRSLDQGYHVDSYGMAEYPRLNASLLQGHQFTTSDDCNDIIRTLRGNLSLTFNTADGISPSTAPTYYSKSPTGVGPGPSNTFPQLGGQGPTGDASSSGKMTLFRQGTDILLAFLREQLEGHRWEIARESFEILQGTQARADYQ
jgi:Fungal specific transcription factor domain